MIVHIVLGALPDPITEGDKTELDTALGRLTTIPGVEHISWGPDFSGRGKGLTFGAVLHLTDRQALQAYGTHPEHLRLVALLNRVMPERLVIDYETGTSKISD